MGSASDGNDAVGCPFAVFISGEGEHAEEALGGEELAGVFFCLWKEVNLGTVGGAQVGAFVERAIAESGEEPVAAGGEVVSFSRASGGLVFRSFNSGCVGFGVKGFVE